MSEVLQREPTTVGLLIERRGDRELLVDLLDGYQFVEIDGAVPGGVDLCVVDDTGLRRAESALTSWKRDQRPVFAPVLLLTAAGGADPWKRYHEALRTTIDGILDIPATRSEIHARIESLLETRGYATELANERRLIERLYDTSPVAMTVLDTDGTIVRANERAEAVLGLQTAAIEGRTYDAPEWNITDPDGDSIPSGELPFDRVIATGEPVFDYELKFELPDGQRALLSVNMAPIRDESGDIEYLVTAMEDITVERRLERELRASEELHRATLENISDTVVMTDDAGQFTYVCPNTNHIFNQSTEEVEALGHIEALLGTDPAPGNLAEVGLVENIELTITDADGAEHVVLVTVKSVSIQAGDRLYTVRDITERAEVERALYETAESRSLALEAADAGVWELDLERSELDWDDSLESVMGIEPRVSQALDDFLEEVVHPEDVSRLYTAIERTLVETDPEPVTVRLLLDDGEVRWIESRGRALTNDAGEPVRLLGIAMDVTDRKQRELELEQYEKIVETAPDPIYALDAGGEITLANRAFAEAVGMTPSDIVGTNIVEHLDPADVEASLEHVMALAEGRDPGTFELTLSTPNGDREYEVNIALHEADEPQDVPGTVGIARDVTEMRQRQRALRRARRAIEASGHAIYITDSDGTITYANPAFGRITGYAPEEAVGRSPSILNAGERPDEYYEELWETILSGEVWDEEIVNRRKDGERYHADQTIAPITDETGAIEGFVGIQTDVTAHKDRLQQLQVMDRVLRHNLHNALNVVLGHADLIKESASGPPVADAQTIIGTGRDLLDLVDKQRSITRVLSTEAAPVSVALIPLVERILADVRGGFPDAQIDLTAPEAVTVRATSDIEMAIRELVDNAIEHSDRESPRVRVTVESNESTASIGVADTGPGIPEVEREIVTGKHRIEPLYHGSGLGLWLVAWIVRRSGGSLAFEENDPRGSVVTITLHRAEDRVNGAE